MPGKAQTTGIALELDVDGSGGGGGGDVNITEVGGVPVTSPLPVDASGSSVSVSNFPATQPISGTVTANLGTIDGAATAANQATEIASLSSIDTKLTAPLSVTETVPTTIFNGQKLVAAPGTQVAIASSIPVKGVMVKALTTNTGLVYVGNSTVSSTDGMPLRAGEFVSMDIANLATVFVDSVVMNEGIAYLAVN